MTGQPPVDEWGRCTACGYHHGQNPCIFRCSQCGHDHASGNDRQCLAQQRTVCSCPTAVPDVQPQDHEIAAAAVVTSWTCPHCSAENDVWGEGAVYSWMTCSSCGRDAYLVMDVDKLKEMTG